MDTAALTKWLNLVALIAIMLSIGLKVSIHQIVAAARDVPVVLRSVAANFVAIPLVTVALLYWFDAAPLVSAGFLILAVCPGAPVAPRFAEIARADVAVATGTMAILGGLSALVTPLLLISLLGWLSLDTEVRVKSTEIVTILCFTQLLPLALGIAVRERLPGLATKLAKPVTSLANLLLLAVVVMILAVQFQTLAALRVRGWFGMTLLLAASLSIGWLCGGMKAPTRRALAVTTGVRNTAVGLFIASSNFPNTPAVTAVIAYAVFSLLGTLGCAVVWAKFPPQPTGSS
jgi:BASS family bile acid:Na+ symporter